MTKTKFLSLVMLVLVCAGAGWFWQQQDLQRMRAENARLLAGAAEADSLREEVVRLRQRQADPAELERLRLSQSELLRLRSETSRMRQQLKDAEQAKRTAPTRPVSPATAPVEEIVSPVTTYSATLRTSLASGQTLITGGWSTEDGKRTLVLVEPVIGEAEMAGQITVQTRFAEMPEDVLAEVGLDWLKSDEPETSKQSVFTPDQAASLVTRLEATRGVNLLSAPRISTLNGRQAQVKIGGTRTVNGVIFDVGPSVDLVPNLSADGRSIDLTVIAQLKLQAAQVR